MTAHTMTAHTRHLPATQAILSERTNMPLRPARLTENLRAGRLETHISR